MTACICNTGFGMNLSCPVHSQAVDRVPSPIPPDRILPEAYSQGWMACAEFLGLKVRAERAALLAETERLREALQIADEMRQHLVWFAKRQWPLFIPNQEQRLAFIRRSGIASATIEAYDVAARMLREET